MGCEVGIFWKDYKIRWKNIGGMFGMRQDAVEK